MGWNFRKSVKVFPGFKLNFSKSGVSGTVGTRGASVTVGPKGVYANASIPNTGIYKRQKIYGNKTSPKNSFDSSLSESLDDNSNKFSIYTLIDGDSIRMPSFSSTYSIPYICSLLMPLLCVIISFFTVFDVWAFLSSIAQIICWVYCFRTEIRNAYEYQWYSGNIELEYYAKSVINSHWKRYGLAISIIVINFIAICASFRFCVQLDSSNACLFFLIVCVIMFFAWMPIAMYDKDYAREWDKLIIPLNEKADGDRNYETKLVFNNIVLGDYTEKYISNEWVKKTEFENYQMYSFKKDIFVDEERYLFDCNVHCIEGKIGYIEIMHSLLNHKNEIIFTWGEKVDKIVKSIYSLYKTKYGSPKEDDAKDNYGSYSFTRTWNYLNQRVVFQHRIFDQLKPKEYYEGTLNQIKVSYVDNSLYQSMRDLWAVEYCKQQYEQIKQAEKEKEEQKKIAEMEELKKKEQLRRESEQV